MGGQVEDRLVARGRSASIRALFSDPSWDRSAIVTVIIDYDAGNLRSVARACAEVGLSAAITNEPAAVRRASRVIFPGVGAAGAAMKSLRANGLDEALRDVYRAGVPVIG